MSMNTRSFIPEINVPSPNWQSSVEEYPDRPPQVDEQRESEVSYRERTVDSDPEAWRSSTEGQNAFLDEVLSDRQPEENLRYKAQESIDSSAADDENELADIPEDENFENAKLIYEDDGELCFVRIEDQAYEMIGLQHGQHDHHASDSAPSHANLDWVLSMQGDLQHNQHEHEVFQQ
jgi:hypothetical protein